MNENNPDELRERLERLREEHREMDQTVEELESAPVPDLLQIRRLKKRKLALKDEIRTLSAMALPDIIA